MAEDEQTIRTGSCLCGAVSYEIRGGMRPVIACHCRQCQKTSGHIVASTACADEQFTLTEDRGLKWFRSSDIARRGFCGECGGNLFYKRLDADQISIMTGTMDPPTGLVLAEHIYVSEKSDYYEIDDGRPEYPKDPPDLSASRRS